jgi:hypothetical protein
VKSVEKPRKNIEDSLLSALEEASTEDASGEE